MRPRKAILNMTQQPDGLAGQELNPIVQILAQYVKDLSFENPNAPRSLQQLGQQGQPKIEVNVNVNARKLGDDVFEVDLKIEASAKAQQGDETTFVVDLLYSGLFGVRNLPDEALEPFLVVEAPRILFPFARRIIADATRDGGFPPLLMEPIDFASLYLNQRPELLGNMVQQGNA
jgi:preprotein translocase subunit SecB